MLTNDVPPVGPSRKLSDLSELCCSTKTNSLVDLDIYFTARNRFKAITRKCKNEYQNQNRHRLVEARNNAKQFWNTLKQEAEKKSLVNSCNISGTDWFNYLKGLLTSQTAEADVPPILDNNSR